MKNSFSFLVLTALSLLLILVVITYYLFSKISATSTADEKTASSGGADALRKHGVNDLASKISYVSSDKTLVWPDEWRQIGTDSSDCEVNTPHCQITASSCFDLQSNLGDKFKVPIDSARGTEEKTGYAIRLLDGKLEIKACFAESQSTIGQELRL
jgi:hypothetical protein